MLFSDRGEFIARRVARTAYKLSTVSRIANWKTFGVLALTILGFIVAARLAQVDTSLEPVYAGKLLSQWLDDGYEPMSLALHEIGPPAAPFIFAKLRREDPDYGAWARYRRIWQRIPVRFRCLLPKPKTSNFDQIRACSALLELGPGVIPKLRVASQDHNSAVKIASSRALNCLRPAILNSH